MIETLTCIRCHKKLDIFEYYKDAWHYEEELLLLDGIIPEDGDVLCDECIDEVML